MAHLAEDAWIVFMACALGCTGGTGSPANHSGAAAGDAGDHTEAAAILTEFVTEYDRRMRLVCPCIVAAGGYASLDVCLEKLGSGPDWVECLTKAVASQDTPELRTTGRCFVDQAKARNACYETTACGTDERMACDAIQVACAVLDSGLTVLVSQKCPDTTILATRL